MRTGSPIRNAIVVGGGAAGLVTARRLLDVGIEPVVLERTGQIGGLWNYDDAPRPGRYAYRSLRTNTSRHTMPFAELPFRPELTDFPLREDVLAYLVRYAETTGVRERVRVETAVTDVRRDRDGWTVETRSRNRTQTLRADALLVCAGIQSEPFIPPIGGLDRFAGIAIHSSAYRTPDPFDGRAVVVVGLGASGVDIATEIARVARTVDVSTANGSWLLPRYLLGHPWDHQLTRVAHALPRRARLAAFEALVRSEYRRLGLHPRSRGLRLPRFEPLAARFTPGAQLLATSADRVRFRPGVAAVSERIVVFTDGTEVAADAIVWATGYRTRLPFMPSGLLEDRADLGLYGHVFPTTTDRVAFVGMSVPAGPAFPIMDLEARWAASVLSGASVLPSPEDMRRTVHARLPSGFDPLRVEYVPHLDALARRAGRHAAMPLDPRGLVAFLAGPVGAPQYV